MERCSIFKISFWVILISQLLGLAGCALSLFPQPGAIAHKDEIVVMQEGVDRSGTIDTDDLQLNYSLKKANNAYSLTGSVIIKPSITSSFDRVKSLFIKMSFLDDAGVVLQTVDVTPLVARYNETPEKIELNKSGPIPVGAKAVAFSWYGSFYSGIVDASSTWDIHHSPFTKQ